ncbi:MAG: hypothetical protein ACYDBV_05205, partial [Nitrospiria bacterium]
RRKKDPAENGKGLDQQALPVGESGFGGNESEAYRPPSTNDDWKSGKWTEAEMKEWWAKNGK